MAGVTVPVDVLEFLEVVELLELLGELYDDTLSGRDPDTLSGMLASVRLLAGKPHPKPELRRVGDGLISTVPITLVTIDIRA